MEAINVFCALLLILKYATALQSECEPVSTKFSYDEQLLEKMIEMGHKVKELEKDMRKTEEYLLSVLAYRREEMNTLSDKLRGDLKAGIGNTTEGLKLITDRLDNAIAPRIAFSAYNPVDKSLQTNEVLILQSVFLNEGNGYDTATGIFTASLGGLYLFTAHICNTVDLVVHYAITLNGEWIARSQQYEENDVSPTYGSCNSVSVLTMMVPGDKVGILCTAGYPSRQQVYDDKHRRNTFLGVLLHK